jgi:DNA topoisomerase I
MTRPQTTGESLSPLRTSPRGVRLHFSTDARPGLHRQASGQRFRYLDPHGHPLRSPAHRERIRKLKIPPAWTDVWICPSQSGHIQATGRDSKGRKQYLYHVKWSELANRGKFEKLRLFGEALPRLRRQVQRDLATPGLSQQKVVAAVIQLLDRAMLRVGNEEYARANGSYGLTTLRDRHVQIRGKQLKFRFPGKSGILQEVGITDRRLAHIVRQCQELPGQELFQYRDSQGTVHRIESSDVNRYLRAVMGHAFSAKDFRTWKATALVWSALQPQSGEHDPRAAKRLVNQALRKAATALGNTLTVCRQYYVHPRITDLFLCGQLGDCSRRPLSKTSGLTTTEQRLLAALQRREKGRRKTRKKRKPNTPQT